MPAKPDLHPLAINILKLQRYNFSFFSCEEAVFFEYIVIKGKSFAKIDSFFHSTSTITSETGIKKHSLKSIISRFEELGIIKVEVKGMPRVKHFKVVFPRIIELLTEIFQLSENGKLNAAFSKLLYDFFQPLADIYLKKNNSNKNNQKENIKEILHSDSDWERSLLLFNEFLFALKYEKRLTDAAVRYNQDILYLSIVNYGHEVVFMHLQEYFNNKGYGATMSDFLKQDKQDYQKLIYIEKKIAAEKQFLDKFIQNLNNTHNQRRDGAGNNKISYSNTSLVINNAMKSQITEALKFRSDNDINNAFIVYCDQVLSGDIKPNKFLPYFFSKKFGEYAVIDDLLDYFNLHYSRKSN